MSRKFKSESYVAAVLMLEVISLYVICLFTEIRKEEHRVRSRVQKDYC